MGIHNRLLAAKGQFPTEADCSSFATWCLWQVLGTGPDSVNGTGWQSGYTGTLAQHGHPVSAATAQPGDLVLYGNPIYHVAIVIGRQNGQLIVVSHGEESGPYIVKYNQWPVNSIRRYLSTAPPPPPAWPWPSTNTIDVLGNAANPSNHVHGMIPTDPPQVGVCIVAFKHKAHLLLGAHAKSDPTSNVWGDGTDADLVAIRAAHNLPSPTPKILNRTGYLTIMALK